MSIETLVAKVGLYLSTYLVCLVSGFVPLVNCELFLIGVAMLVPGLAVIPILLLSTLGQMTAKVAMYFGGKGLVGLSVKQRARLEALKEKLSRKPSRLGIITFVSGALGLPPFFLVSILMGSLGLGLGRFLLWGSLGRMLRFAVVLLSPEAVRGLMS
ncbi:MAG: hypothetical protein HY698_02980 [Deltaproteobacteria bacterium]|nr:hypothetical protein [Deltaproteobacteria bacterium]